MPTVYITEADRLDANFTRIYKFRTAVPKLSHNEMSRRTGIPCRSLYDKIRNPGLLRLSELRAIAKTCGMDAADLAKFILGGET